MRGSMTPCPRVLYMAVTDDIYEMPVAVCDTAQELARTLGRGPATVYSLLSRSRDGVAFMRREGLKLFRMDADTGEVVRRAQKARSTRRNRTCGEGRIMVK